MKHAILLSAVPVDAAMKRYCRPGSFVVACDAGYRNSDCLGVRPNLIVGDFDSAPQPDTDSDTIVLPHVKDDTDTHYAAKWLLENGYTQVTMLGLSLIHILGDVLIIAARNEDDLLVKAAQARNGAGGAGTDGIEMCIRDSQKNADHAVCPPLFGVNLL